VGTCNLMTAWVASTKNRFYINQNRNTANSWNDIIDKCIEKDEQLIDEFHKIGDGKFYGQALSEHFNFRFWNDNNNQLPLKVFCYPANKKRMLVSKTDESWFSTGREYTQTNYTINDFLRPDVSKISLEISCASKESTQYRIECDVQWLEFSKTEGITDKTDIIDVTIDRKKLGEIGQAIVKIWGDPDICTTLTFNANSEEYVRELVYADQADDAKTYEAQADDAKNLKTYIGFTGYTVVEAEHYSDKTVSVLEKADIEDRTKAAGKEAHYECLKPYGITGSGMKLYPNTLDATLLSEKPYLEYNVYAFEDGEYEAQFVFAPSTPVTDILDQSFGVSVNGGEISRVNTVVDLSRPFHNSLQWVLEAKAGAKRTNCKIDLKKGRNIIRYYQLSPNLIFERFVVAKDIKAVPESYLGPTESYCVK
ncbi:MAG: hypothetical protein MJ107_08695, partial [Lachnospiraceae bacterium]|nr:hypothetical protein [Lachnospiraceae bacterium]